MIDWIKNIERLFSFLGVPSSKKVACDALQLRLQADDRWEAKKQELLATARDRKISWTNVQDSILEQYLPLAVSQKKEEFMTLKQENMSVEDYKSEFSKLTTFASSIIPTKKARMNRFIKDLNDDKHRNVFKQEI